VLFPIPDDLTRQQAQELIFAARLLIGQPVRTEYTSMTFTIKADRVASFLELDAARIAGGILTQTRPYTVTCGTHDLDLGPHEVKASRMRLANADELYAAVGTGVEPVARYECIEGEGIYVQLAATRPAQASDQASRCS
jgi:hypothetical protein